MGKLTPGERAKHWASAFMALWPAWVFVLGMLGYTNKDEIKGFMITNHDEAITTLTPFQRHMREEVERIDLEEATGRAELMARLNELEKTLKRQDTANYRSQDKEIEALKAEMATVRALVN